MTTAVFDTLKASDNLKAAGIEAKQAEAIVHTMAGAFEDTVATKSDVVAIRADMDKLAVPTQANIAVLRADIWRIGISIAGGAVLLNKALDWLIR